MKIIKLNAIDSTNDYLKALSREKTLENFTVVTANFQTKGRGQIQNNWHSKKDKNLLFSILINKFYEKITNPFKINALVSLAINDVISTIIPNVKIKWPNDIMSRHKKICGILAETTFSNSSIKNSIIGIGINVNQLVFPKELIKATSINSELGRFIDKDELLIKIIESIKNRFNTDTKALKTEYHQKLYQFNKPSMYKKSDGTLFLGKIIGVTKQGRLQVELGDETIKTFDLKEIIYL